MSLFKERVLKAIKMIPHGQVASYGQIATIVGIPRGARQVGWILRGLDSSLQGDTNFPWWRVINNEGRISIKGNKFSDANLQKEKLAREGINVSETYKIDIEKYRFRPLQSQLSELELDDTYIDFIIEKYKVEFN